MCEALGAVQRKEDEERNLVIWHHTLKGQLTEHLDPFLSREEQIPRYNSSLGRWGRWPTPKCLRKEKGNCDVSITVANPEKTDWRGKDLLWLTVSEDSWGAGFICFRLVVRQNIMAAGPQAGEVARSRRATENIGRAWIRASIRAYSQ